MSGIGVGIRRLSETCFFMAMLLMSVTLLMEDTFYILDLFIQSVGFYIQNLVQLGTHTDTLEKQGLSHGFKDRGR